MAKKTSLKTLTKKLDRLVSQYIRRKYADKNGYVRCYTCGKPLQIKEAHCGHFISRRHLATRWLEDNLRPQCPLCNLWENGEQFLFGKRLQEDGIDIEKLRKKSKQTITKEERLELLNYYQEKLEKIK